MEQLLRMMGNDIGKLEKRKRDIVVERAVLQKEADLVEEYRYILTDFRDRIVEISERSTPSSEIWMQGAKNALYEICKELDVSSQDIRESGLSIDEMAAQLAERIKQVYAEEVPTSGE